MENLIYGKPGKPFPRHRLFEYIEVFNNRQRKHSFLGYKSPVDFLQQQTMAMASSGVHFFVASPKSCLSFLRNFPR